MHTVKRIWKADLKGSVPSPWLVGERVPWATLLAFTLTSLQSLYIPNSVHCDTESASISQPRPTSGTSHSPFHVVIRNPMAGSWHTAMSHTLKHLQREILPNQTRQPNISHLCSFVKLEQCYRSVSREGGVTSGYISRGITGVH